MKIKYPHLKIAKIGSVGGGYITLFTVNLNLALQVIDLCAVIDEVLIKRKYFKKLFIGKFVK